MSNWFDVKYNKLAIILTPTFLRKPRMRRWLEVLIRPLEKIYEEWYINRIDNLYTLGHNGQVCYLRKALNDEFDVELRRIQITDGESKDAFYIYTEGENNTKWLYPDDENKPIYLNAGYTLAGTGADFYVLVPAGLVYNENKMKALIDFYRLASKRYKILNVIDRQIGDIKF